MPPEGFMQAAFRMINALDFGADPSGAMPSTGALQKAVNKYMIGGTKGYPGVFLIPPGHYKVSSMIVFQPLANMVGGMIYGYGATIEMTGPDKYGFSVDTESHGHLWRDLHVFGLRFKNCGFRLQSGPGRADAIYGYTLECLAAENFPEHGIYVTKAFEGAIKYCHMIAASGNLTNYPIYITGDGASSTEVIGCSTRGGKNGLKCDQGDIKIIGGTYLTAQESGISLSCLYSFLEGVHVENNWESAGNITNGGPGIHIIGWGTVVGCYGTSNRYQRYVVGVFANMVISIYGGLKTGSVVAYAYLDGAANSTIMLAGGQGDSYEEASGWRTIRFGKLILLGEKSFIAPRVVSATDSASAAIDLDKTDQYQLTAIAHHTSFSVTGSPVDGQPLRIRLKDAGAARTLTWSSTFRAIGCTLPAATVAGRTTYLLCYYNLTDSKVDVVDVKTEA
jgi:hypothetical protein